VIGLFPEEGRAVGFLTAFFPVSMMVEEFDRTKIVNGDGILKDSYLSQYP
jgi:hypothetical protein